MTDNELDELLCDCPVLYHMAMRDSWPLIAKFGLLPTDGLLELFEVDPVTRTQLTSKRRPASVKIEHAELGAAFVRDQIPLYDEHLAACLEDNLSPKDWHRRLNERVFFWLSRARLQTMLCAGAYRKMEHIVLTLDARSVVEKHRAQIELSPMNSGATQPWKHPRGAGTFLPIGSYPYEAWRKKRKKGERVVELTVLGGVPDLIDHVREVRVMSCEGEGQILYSK